MAAAVSLSGPLAFVDVQLAMCDLRGDGDSNLSDMQLPGGVSHGQRHVDPCSAVVAAHARPDGGGGSGHAGLRLQASLAGRVVDWRVPADVSDAERVASSGPAGMAPRRLLDVAFTVHDELGVHLLIAARGGPSVVDPDAGGAGRLP